MTVQVVWLKRDLRVFDHRPLFEAAQHGRLVPLYIVEPALWQQADSSARQWRFVRQCLEELDQKLRHLYGQGLVVRVGEAVNVLCDLQQAYGVNALWSHAETGNAWTYARDRDVAAWAREQGIPWHEYRQDGVICRLNSRYGWAEHWARFMADPTTPVPESLQCLKMASEPLPEAEQLCPASATLPDACPAAQAGGRSHALRLLDSFLHVRGVNYAKGMSSPLTAETACSRLSPHLAYGTLSMREVVHACEARKAEIPAGWGRALAAFTSRLAWQSHFMQKLESEPALEFYNLHPALRFERQALDPVLFDAWAHGKTGYPLIDACMRMLHATGWINFRMRAMLAAFACYHLWQPWREAGLHLARLFIDYEPGIHWSQMQMQSGSTGINAFRIYNPVKQSRDQDPDGHFIRRWIPELKRVPAEWIHEPWRLTADLQRRYGCLIGTDYPKPVVEHESAARAAREQLHRAYKGTEARHASRQVLDKHGSRKKHAPIPRKTANVAPKAQMSLFE
ncbi:MAG TPA: deoxyribodipyrimidine photo-lyase [bacterium]|nr:deoxyribodipyrimidine photo-lyase [bacterium]